MLSQSKWVRTGLASLMVVALSSGAAWAKGKPPRLSDPKNLASSEITEDSITLTWDSGGGETGFIVGYLEDALPNPKCEGLTPIDVGTATSCVVDGLSPGTTYGFRVCAYSSRKTSDGATLSDKTLGDNPEGPPVTYSITWLDAFDETEANGVNSDGHVVGPAWSPDRYEGGPFAYLYTPEAGMVDLNTLLPENSGWHLLTAFDINDRGQIAGEGYFTGFAATLGYRYTPAVLDGEGNELLPADITAIGPLNVDDLRTSARGINELGEVCGFSRDASGQNDAWFYSDELGMVTLLEGGHSVAMNESSQVLVESGEGGTIRVIPFNDAESFGVLSPFDMNDDGHFVGFAPFEVPINKKRTRTEYRAVRHDGSDIFDLGAGTGSGAYGINNLGDGDVVGYLPRDSDTFTNDGFVYLDSFQQLVNLDDAVVGDEADFLLWFHETSSKRPQRINDAGQIIGDLSNYELLGSGLHAFVLTPIPPEN